MSSVYFGGSRSLSQKWQALVGSVVQSVVSSGQSVQVGCQSGADQQVIHSACLLPHPFNSPRLFLVVFAVAPSLALSPRLVQWAVTRGVSVRFSAGGSAPIKARYLLRSIAAFQGCSQAVFFSPGSGSLAVARECVRSGLPVFAFGSCPAPVPSVAGQWVKSSFAGRFCWQWQAPAQLSLF